MNYVDGFVLPIPTKNVQLYRRIAQKAGKVWREHGALEYRECEGDDLDVQFGVSSTRTIKLKPGETVGFSWIVFGVAGPSRSRQRKGNERPPQGKVDGGGADTLRRQAHGLRRFQSSGRLVAEAFNEPVAESRSADISLQ